MTNGDAAGGGAADSMPGSRFLWRAIALAAGGGGVFMLGRGHGSTSLAILLLVVGLAASGVLLGGPPFGDRVEGRLDLSARLGLGLLGGVLGALVSAVLRAALVGLGWAGLIGVTLDAGWTGPTMLAHFGSGAVWGMVLGILYPLAPGTSPAIRGAWFSLIPSLYLLLKVYPVDRHLGVLGLDLGALTFVFVLALNAFWGLVAGSTIGWGEVADEAPVARPIDV